MSFGLFFVVKNLCIDHCVDINTKDEKFLNYIYKAYLMHCSK